MPSRVPTHTVSRNPSLASEPSSRAVQSLLRERERDGEFESMDDLNRFLKSAIADGSLHRRTQQVPSDPIEHARFLCWEAERADSARSRGQMLRQALRLDPECAQAGLMLLYHQRLGAERRIARLRELVAMAERRLGPDRFIPPPEAFWGDHDTRPYMRTRRMLALELVWIGHDEGADHLRALLELCPDDNLGLRDDLLAWYLEHQQGQQALELISHYPHDGSLTFAWGTAIALAQLDRLDACLVQFRNVFHDHPGFAVAFLEPEALEHFIGEFSGQRPPDDFEPRSISEIEYAFCQIGRAMMRTPSSAEPCLRALSAEVSPQGRNAPCACGSGRKFKKCCGRPQ